MSSADALRHQLSSSRFLSVERNAAPLTIKSYREDLTSLADYLTQACGRDADAG